MPKQFRPSGKKRALKEQKHREAEHRQAFFDGLSPQMQENHLSVNKNVYNQERAADPQWQRLVVGNI